LLHNTRKITTNIYVTCNIVCVCWVVTSAFDFFFHNIHFFYLTVAVYTISLINHDLYVALTYCDYFLSQLGFDTFAQEYLEIFKRENVDASRVRIQSDKHSGVAHITVAENGTF